MRSTTRLTALTGLVVSILVAGGTAPARAQAATEGMPSAAPTAADSAAIVRTALDYIEGWYAGDAERMERSLHPELAKRIVHADAGTGRDAVDHMTAAQLVEGTRRGGGRGTPADEQRKEVRILDTFGNAASVRVDASGWVDYMHLGRVDGEWKIINVLWALRPESS
jgi:hypothetical protein